MSEFSGVHLERRIIIGMIVSTEFLGRISRIWDSSLLESEELRQISDWCWYYYQQYQEAPDTNIEAVYMEQLRTGTIWGEQAEYVEDLLVTLSDEYGRGTQFNAGYLYDQAVSYLKGRELERHGAEVQALVDAGRPAEAEQLLQSYSPTITTDEDTGLDLASESAVERIRLAFSEERDRVITYPGALGGMWNEQLIRGGFVAFLAPEKRGKTFWLLELSLRGVRQKANIAFFAVGDMTEQQMLRRICVYMSRKSDREQYCKERFVPVGDCVHNQLDTCERQDRNCDHGIYSNTPLDIFWQNIGDYVQKDALVEKGRDFPDYQPCDSYTCGKRVGTVWLQPTPETDVLTAGQATKKAEQFFHRYRRRYKLYCCPAGTLTVSGIKTCLNSWERYDGFVPDIVLIDYADLLSADDGSVQEFRHRQDHIWKSLRGLSQERHALVVTATQADASSYEKGRLSMSNFSEDKRKYAHVTAQYGLNQDPKGREKELGIMRINEIVVREGDFSANNEVTVLQDLASGRPYLESY